MPRVDIRQIALQIHFIEIKMILIFVLGRDVMIGDSGEVSFHLEFAGLGVGLDVAGAFEVGQHLAGCLVGHQRCSAIK